MPQKHGEGLRRGPEPGTRLLWVMWMAGPMLGSDPDVRHGRRGQPGAEEQLGRALRASFAPGLQRSGAFLEARGQD